jgi:hypothetical protein
MAIRMMMLLAAASCALGGFVLGLAFRAPALIVATLAVVVLSTILHMTSGMSFGAAMISTLVLMIVLQFSYAAGLLAERWFRGGGEARRRRGRGNDPAL